MTLARVEPWLRGAALLLLVFALVAPLPIALLDLLLVANLAASLVVLAACATARPPRLVSALPAVLLGGTVVRLALELAASRMILRGGDAGTVIHAFGSVAVRGDALVGVAVFVILTVVQFVVVVQGGERVAEVAARFALDAMPGQQLAIDGAVRAGTLDARAAKRDRDALEQRAQRAGAMDGAMRFVKGDAIAGVVIVLVNLVVGTVLGATRSGLPVRAAAERYATLAIGQGLAAQVPSMLLAVAAALAVSRPQSRLDESVWVAPMTLRTVAGVLLAVAVAPGFPLWPFATIAAVLLALSFAPRPARLVDARVRLTVTSDAGGQALATDARAEWSRSAEALGISAPSIEVVRSEGEPTLSVDGTEHLRGHWTNDDVASLVRSTAPTWVDVDDTERRLDKLSIDSPALVRSTVPTLASIANLTALRRWLCDEGVPVGDLRAMLGAIQRAGAVGDSVDRWRSRVRVELGPTLQAHFAPRRALSAWMLGPTVEDAARDELARRTTLSPALVGDLRDLVAARCNMDEEATILASVAVRRAVWEALRSMPGRRTVLAPDELGDAVAITVLGVLDPML